MTDDVTIPSAQQRPDPTLLLSACLAGAALLALWLTHATASFFITDDYAIIALAPTLSLRDLLTTAPGRFFRPIALLVFAAESRLFGWSHPAAYAVVSVLLHSANALLVGLLLRAFGTATPPAVLAGVLFLAAPWAAEAVFTKSGQFDLLATGLALGTLLLFARTSRAPKGPTVLATFLLAALSAAALLAKESAAPLPALVAVAAFGLGVPVRRAAAGVLAAGGAAAGYLLLRSESLPGLASPYGSYFGLLGSADLPARLWGFLRALAWLPALSPAAVFVPAALWLAALARAAASDRRRGATFGALFLVSLAPVLFITVSAGSLNGGRFLYLPGAFAVAAAASGLTGLSARNVAAAVLLGTAIAFPSLWRQRTLWLAASHTARSAIAAFSQHLDSDVPLTVSDLPKAFVEGARILNGYAFRYYYGERLKVPVHTEGILLELTPAGPRAVGRVPDDTTGPPLPGSRVVRVTTFPLPD